jgi:hypothetical protein
MTPYGRFIYKKKFQVQAFVRNISINLKPFNFQLFINIIEQNYFTKLYTVLIVISPSSRLS